MSPIIKSNITALILLSIGSSQMIGYLTGSKTLRGIGAASMISPCPKVFCVAKVQDEQGGMLETFSSQFSLAYSVDGIEHVMPFNPETGQLLRGPYNRRNVYGAALSYAPCLPPELVHEILDFGLQPQGALRSELGIPAEASSLKLIVKAGVGSGPKRWEFPISSVPQLSSTISAQ